MDGPPIAGIPLIEIGERLIGQILSHVDVAHGPAVVLAAERNRIHSTGRFLPEDSHFTLGEEAIRGRLPGNRNRTHGFRDDAVGVVQFPTGC